MEMVKELLNLSHLDGYPDIRYTYKAYQRKLFSEFLFEYFNIIETGNFPEQLIDRC